jgi:hypothetical protein
LYFNVLGRFDTRSYDDGAAVFGGVIALAVLVEGASNLDMI